MAALIAILLAGFSPLAGCGGAEETDDPRPEPSATTAPAAPPPPATASPGDKPIPPATAPTSPTAATTPTAATSATSPTAPSSAANDGELTVLRLPDPSSARVGLFVDEKRVGIDDYGADLEYTLADSDRRPAFEPDATHEVALLDESALLPSSDECARAVERSPAGGAITDLEAGVRLCVRTDDGGVALLVVTELADDGAATVEQYYWSASRAAEIVDPVRGDGSVLVSLRLPDPSAARVGLFLDDKRVGIDDYGADLAYARADSDGQPALDPDGTDEVAILDDAAEPTQEGCADAVSRSPVSGPIGDLGDGLRVCVRTQAGAIALLTVTEVSTDGELGVEELYWPAGTAP